MQPGTEEPHPPVTDVASPPPAGFVIVLWIGAFSALLWGMMVLFGRRMEPGPKGPPEPPKP